MAGRRMTSDERAEIEKALEEGRIDNASQFARAFAADRGLNASTVRTAISRLKRRHPAPVRRVVGAPGTGLISRLLTADPGEVAAAGAAALVRYRVDRDFKQVVDACRPEIEEIY